MGSIPCHNNGTHVSNGTVKNVAVIGAGISGVVSAAHLAREGFEVTVFERTGVIGGVWYYDTRVDRDPPFPNTIPPDPNWTEIETQGLSLEDVALIHGPPGPCYAGLRNNVPTSILRSSLLPWPEGTDEFTDQGDVRQYVEDVARAGGIIEKIHFYTRVESVSKPVGARQWSVETSQLELADGTHSIRRETSTFGAVVVASGHYHIPFVPDVPGLATWKERFPGRVMHSKKYRTPAAFKGKTVLLIGAGSSALDIAKEIDELGGKVYQSMRESKYDLTASKIPKSVERVPMAVEFVVDEAADRDFETDLRGGAIPGTVVLEDGRVLEGIDHVVVSTGYITSYPFLGHLEQPSVPWEEADDKVLITSDGHMTHNLHKDIFYIPDPSLSFIGVSHLVSTFSLFDFQAQVMAKVFSGKVRLPPESVMKQEHKARKARFQPGDRFHTIPSGEQSYIYELLDWVNKDLTDSGLEPIEGLDKQWHVSYEVLKAKMKVYQPGKPLEPDVIVEDPVPSADRLKSETMEGDTRLEVEV